MSIKYQRLKFLILLPAFLLNSMLFATCQPDTFSKFPNECFVETGSLKGYGIAMALNAGFKTVYSMEINPEFHNICKQKYKRDHRVKLFLGDSSTDLYAMIAQINTPATFWLDAHVATGETGCPILQELDAIKMHPIKNHTILIDDVRIFGTFHFDFITISDVINKILEINPNYQISYVNGYVDNDILVARVPH